jgi:Thioesterase superfamily
MDARIKSGHDGVSCAASIDVRSCAFASITGNADMTDSATPKPTYGVSSIEVMASMPGLDFVRGIFARTLPEPPIMENVEPFDCTAESGYTTLEFKISFVRGMSQDTGKIRTEGRVLNAGRRAATAEGRITDQNGKLIAHATTTCMVFELPKSA